MLKVLNAYYCFYYKLCEDYGVIGFAACKQVIILLFAYSQI